MTTAVASVVVVLVVVAVLSELHGMTCGVCLRHWGFYRDDRCRRCRVRR